MQFEDLALLAVAALPMLTFSVLAGHSIIHDFHKAKR